MVSVLIKEEKHSMSIIENWVNPCPRARLAAGDDGHIYFCPDSYILPGDSGSVPVGGKLLDDLMEHYDIEEE